MMLLFLVTIILQSLKIFPAVELQCRLKLAV